MRKDMGLKKNKNYVFEDETNKKGKKVLFCDIDYAPKNEFVNPFLNKDNPEKSIEDYPVYYKHNIFRRKQYVYLGSVIRNEHISKNKKWDTFKKYLDKVSKDYQTKIKTLVKDNKVNEENDLIEDVNYPTFKIIFLLIIISAIAVCSYLFLRSIISNKYFLTGIGLSAVLLIINIIILIRYKYNINKIKNENRMYYLKIRKYLKVEKKVFSKYYKKIYKYYKKMIFKCANHYFPFDFISYWSQLENYDNAFKNNEEILKNTQRFNSYSKHYKKVSRVFTTLIVILIIALCALIVMEIIK